MCAFVYVCVCERERGFNGQGQDRLMLNYSSPITSSQSSKHCEVKQLLYI